jgi:hypothetical protein
VDYCNVSSREISRLLLFVLQMPSKTQNCLRCNIVFKFTQASRIFQPMKKLKSVLFVFSCFFVVGAHAQTTEQVIIKQIEQLFDGMRESDSAKVSAVFHPDAVMLTSYQEAGGVPKMHRGDLQTFLTSIGTEHPYVWDEKIYSYDIRISDNLAQVWTEYAFWRGDKRSHCGINAFQLVRLGDGWKIVQITDTRRRRDCPNEETEMRDTAVNLLVDNWHIAAATADETVFFGSMSDNAIYLGTDETERWTKTEFEEWSKKYFEREKAWNFKPRNRVLYYSADGQTAWFEEKLDTWMGVCVGSGVLTRSSEGWKISHYHLGVTIPNDLVDKFIKLVEKGSK